MAPATTALPTVLMLFACSTGAPAGLVDGVLTLPPALREISAIVAVDDDTVACVQDELGTLFFVSLSGRQPMRSVWFADPGDYEGLARIEADYWVLRSDGLLLHLERDGDGLRLRRRVRLPDGFSDWEGLCYDVSRGFLLVMPKARGDGGKGAQDQRPVFAVDPRTGIVQQNPFLTLHRRDLIEQAAARGLPLPMRTTQKGTERIDLELACTELAVVPGSDELLLLAASDGVLLRVDFHGRLLGTRLLDRTQLPQAEGLGFLADGRLLVASEGVDGQARLCLVALP